jgi:carboxypeptidase Q
MSLSSKFCPRAFLDRNVVRTGTLLTVPLVTLLLSVSVIGQEAVDLNVVHRIRQEALQNSQVMEHLFYLTDVHGPRLTNAPGFFAAADWVVKQLKQWGISAQQEEWGPSGRGWTFTRFSAHLIEPQYASLIGVPLAYTPGTSGPVTADVTIAAIASEADFAKYRGTLRGKIVLLGNGRELPMSTQPLASRRSDSDLAALAVAPEGRGNTAAPGAVAAAGRSGRGGRGAPPAGAAGAATPVSQRALNQFLAEEGAAVVVRIGGGRSEGGTVFAQSGGSRDPKEPVPPPTIALTPEHYNRIARLLDHGIPVRAQVEVEARFLDDRTTSVNVVGEIPGGRRKDEIVMIGAHLDSWHGGTGATDNAAGSAVMIEVMRILKTLNLRLDRTVRLGLWSGEEQGLLGSRAYVTQHFAAREDMKPKPEHAKLSAYFNVDNGSGKIRGIYLQGNDAVRPIFDTWFKPFADLGASTVSIRNTGGTDHTSFDAVGLPGFQFIQDPLEYDSRTHHSNMDVYDRVQRGDLMQMAAIVASFVYNAANRDELLPRKALPRPQPAPAPAAPALPAAPRTQP